MQSIAIARYTMHFQAARAPKASIAYNTAINHVRHFISSASAHSHPKRMLLLSVHKVTFSTVHAYLDVVLGQYSATSTAIP